VFLGESESLADPTPRADPRTRGNIEDRVYAPVLRHAATIQLDANGIRREIPSPAFEGGRLQRPACAATTPRYE